MVPDLDAAPALAALVTVERAAPGIAGRPDRARAGADGDAAVSALVAPGNPLPRTACCPYTALHHLLFSRCRAPTAAPDGDRVRPRATAPTSPSASTTTRRWRGSAAWPTPSAPTTGPSMSPATTRSCVSSTAPSVPVRRSRGYAPLPDPPAAWTWSPTLGRRWRAEGTFCLAAGAHAWISQHIGDIGNLETARGPLGPGAPSFCRMYGIDPEVNAVDAHPGYLRADRLSLERALARVGRGAAPPRPRRRRSWPSTGSTARRR